MSLPDGQVGGPAQRAIEIDWSGFDEFVGVVDQPSLDYFMHLAKENPEKVNFVLEGVEIFIEEGVASESDPVVASAYKSLLKRFLKMPNLGWEEIAAKLRARLEAHRRSNFLKQYENEPSIETEMPTKAGDLVADQIYVFNFERSENGLPHNIVFSDEGIKDIRNSSVDWLKIIRKGFAREQGQAGLKRLRTYQGKGRTDVWEAKQLGVGHFRGILLRVRIDGGRLVWRFEKVEDR